MSRLVTAGSLEQALDVISQGGAKVLAGGTDLMIELRQARQKSEQTPPTLLDVTRIADMRRLDISGPEPFIGAAVTFSELEADPAVREIYPVLAAAAGSVGSRQIRNTGTIGGNAANASPAADGICALTALGARAVVASAYSRRTLGLGELITAPNKNSLQKNEIIVGFKLDRLPYDQGQAFVKVGRRQAVAVARLNLAVCLDPGLTDPRVALGSCFPTPRRLTEVEELLREKGPGGEVFERAGELAASQFTNVCGIRHSSVYKVPAISAMTTRALSQAWANVGGSS